jgi:transposase
MSGKPSYRPADLDLVRRLAADGKTAGKIAARLARRMGWSVKAEAVRALARRHGIRLRRGRPRNF